MTQEKSFEDLVDDIRGLLETVDPDKALLALVACTMGAVGECANPHRALLAVISELTGLVRFHEAYVDDEEKVLPLNEWVEDAWNGEETENEEDDEDLDKAIAEEYSQNMRDRALFALVRRNGGHVEIEENELPKVPFSFARRENDDGGITIVASLHGKAN